MNTWDRRKWVGVRLAGLAAALAVGASAAAGVGGAPRFERDVLPVLQANCVSCHGEAVRQGGLDLRTPASLRRGGRGGPAVALGAPEKSPVFRRAANGTMPPGNARKLNASELDLLRRWIRAGAPEGAALPAGSAASAGKNHWAFQPVRLPAVPRVRNGAWVRNPVDAFILARLEARGLSGPGEAAPRVLLRRLYLDLLGLPPTPEEQEAYLADRSPERYERWVDRLLARPEYGERWGRRWLDVARYAESNGYERDGTKPHAWRYRDYVIQSLNADKPADRFLVEQIAGDELPDTNAEAQIATTFLRLGTWDDEPAEPAVDRYDQLDDVLGVTATAFMGLTLRCARCHDHKFEPISQKDYYRTLAVFMPLQRPQRGRTDLDVLAGTRTELANYHRAVEEAGRRTAADQERLWRVKDGILSRLIATGKNKLPTEATTAFRTGPAARNAAQRKLVEQHSEAVERELRKEQTAAETAERGEIEARIQAASPPEPPRAYLWKEEGPVPETRVLRRGDPQHPEDRVGPEIPSALAAFPAGPLQPTGPSSGRRLWFARWLASPTHPLTGRVLVNRIWQGHFGEGLVPSENDFGVAGQRPTHPELLDWLAYRFTAAAPAGMGWSWKRLHRTILLSSTYRATSGWSPNQGAADPEGQLYSRWRPRRLEAEAVRDSILAVSGSLNPKRGGPSVYPTLPPAVLASQSRPGDGWGKSEPAEAARRSVYVFSKRSLAVPELEALDAPDTTSPCEQRPVSTTAPQALTFLNGEFVTEQARTLAARLAREAGPDAAARIRRAFLLALCRPPSGQELADGVQFLAAQQARIEQEGRSAPQQPPASLESFCRVLLNTNEFFYTL